MKLFTTFPAALLVAIFAIACTQTTKTETNDTPEAKAEALQSVDFDKTMGYSGGKLRLVVTDKETRFWPIGKEGAPDEEFKKNKADVSFFLGGSEAMMSGMMMKGDAKAGYATTMLNHRGKKVEKATISVGSEKVMF